LLENGPKISLPLPLPDIYDDWGVATLFLKFKPRELLSTIGFLLLESSVLVVGTRSEEVGACTSALLTLLKPFQWASAFIPSIPHGYLDLVCSPVPFS